MKVPVLLIGLMIGAILGGGVFSFCYTQDRIKRMEQKLDFFQKIWENVPEEYRKEVAP